MSDLERNRRRDAAEDAEEIKTFVADDPELIDPNWDDDDWDDADDPPVPRRPRKWLPLFLFAATCASTWLAGTVYVTGIPQTGLTLEVLLSGLEYSVAVMAILLAHEMGHYLAARYHGVPASLPYFLPMPISPLGTMGAVIVQGRGVADRRQMFDIAIAGPLAGLVLALPAAWYGMEETRVMTVPPGAAVMVYGDPIVMQWMKEYFHGPLQPNQDVALTPLLMAGWVGIFVTALNLIPIGQLDGGHMLYCLIGRRAHTVAVGLLMFAVGWMIFTGNMGYMLLVVLLFLFGARHPPTANDAIPLGPIRGLLGWLTLAFIVIGFTPNPMYELRPAPRQAAPARMPERKPNSPDETVTRSTHRSPQLLVHRIEGRRRPIAATMERRSAAVAGFARIQTNWRVDDEWPELLRVQLR